MHCIVQPGFLDFRMKIPFWEMLFVGKFADRQKFTAFH